MTAIKFSLLVRPTPTPTQQYRDDKAKVNVRHSKCISYISLILRSGQILCCGEKKVVSFCLELSERYQWGNLRVWNTASRE